MRKRTTWMTFIHGNRLLLKITLWCGVTLLRFNDKKKNRNELFELFDCCSNERTNVRIVKNNVFLGTLPLLAFDNLS